MLSRSHVSLVLLLFGATCLIAALVGYYFSLHTSTLSDFKSLLGKLYSYGAVAGLIIGGSLAAAADESSPLERIILLLSMVIGYGIAVPAFGFLSWFIWQVWHMV